MTNLIIAAALAAGGAFLFYRSVWGMIPGMSLAYMFMRSRKKKWESASIGRLKEQFISGMQMVSGSLTAGYSMENAWRRAARELEALYGRNAEFCIYMRQMNQRLAVNEPLEKILNDFADQCGLEDICRFAEVYSYAKRSGGNLTEIIRSVTGRMQERAEVMTEIETTVASKKMEQSIMNILMPGILLFVTVSSPSYVSALYHNALGILVMSVSLAGYIACMVWSQKLMDIPV
ncbi:MAG: type II secretion system F family protein [Clostridiales bacterium]|nr:type II secretion system F family protein [Clostridiales bacterium]